MDPLVIVAAILSTLNSEGPAPDGVIYAGVMDRVSLSSYQGLIAGLIKVGLIEKEWDQLYQPYEQQMLSRTLPVPSSALRGL